MRNLEECETVYLLGHVDTAEEVELQLVALEFRKVPVIEVSTTLEVLLFKDNHAAAFVANSYMFACRVEAQRREPVQLSHVVLLALAETCQVDPLDGGLLDFLVLNRVLLAWNPFIFNLRNWRFLSLGVQTHFRRTLVAFLLRFASFLGRRSFWLSLGTVVGVHAGIGFF